MKRHYLLCFFLIQSILLFSQNKENSNNDSDVLVNTFGNLNQEKFYLHTNKTTYFVGEKIWWSAYIVSDFNNTPTTNTTNLHLNFYGSDKKLISNQLFYCDNGKAFGEIVLPENLITGRYYINLNTQWNKNFTNKHITIIDVINPKLITKKNTINESVNNDLKIEFHPESGSLLKGINNTIFYSIKQGDTYIPDVTGYILNNTTGEKTTKFKSNVHGCGMFRLFYNSDDSHTAHLNFNNKEYAFNINTDYNTGLIIQKNLAITDVTPYKFSIKLDESTAKLKHNKTIFAVIHRNDKFLYAIPFKINKKHLKYGLQFLDENLFDGFNYISIFDDTNTMMAQRPFFNKNIDALDFSLLKREVSKDSLELDFILKDTIASSLSISVLPKLSKQNNNPTNILDELLVYPYLKSRTNSKFILNSNLSDLDKDIFFQVHTKALRQKAKQQSKTHQLFKKEEGITIKGGINTEVENLEKHSILLSSTENEILLTTKVKNDKSFEFNKLNLKNQTNYKLALLDQKGKIVKAGFYLYDTNQYKADSLLIYEPSILKTSKEKQYSITEEKTDYTDFNNDSRTKLDEVVVFGKVETDEPEDLLYENNPEELGNGFTRILRVTDLDRSANTVIEFLDRQPGVTAKETPSAASIRLRGVTTIAAGAPKDPLIMLDGVPIPTEALIQMRLIDIESIKINSIGAGYGVRGSNGVISIISTYKNKEFKIKPNANYFLGETDFGFEISKSEYENSTLTFNTDLSRSYFETLDWIPNMELLPKKSNLIKVYVGDHKNIKLFINGFNEKGYLVYKEIELLTK